eukprot:2522994-Amphidinium_carterae.1
MCIRDRNMCSSSPLHAGCPDMLWSDHMAMTSCNALTLASEFNVCTLLLAQEKIIRHQTSTITALSRELKEKQAEMERLLRASPELAGKRDDGSHTAKAHSCEPRAPT